MNTNPAWNKGKKFPHTPEWEAARLAALRKSAVLQRGIPTGRKPTTKVMAALRQWVRSNLEKVKKNAIANLPKDCTGSKNGNWKGGVTLITRGLRFTKEYQSWRKLILERDGKKCKICGATDGLQVHHLIPVSQYPDLATLPMNGVTLCTDCHYLNDTAWQGERYKRVSIGNALALIFTIPHKFQAYQTVGNWQFTESGIPVIFVSKLSDRRYEILVALHELHEVCLCKHAGITQQQVDNFDIKFEATRPEGDDSEPGDAPNCPYRLQHFRATNLERMMADNLDVNWQEYEAELNSL